MRTPLLVAVLVWGLSASAQSMQLAEMAADRCMYDVALTYLDKAPKRERDSRLGLLLRARLLIQLDRGVAAVEILQRLSPTAQREEEADRLLALGLALSSAKRLEEADKALVSAREAGADRDVVEEALAVTLIQRGKLDEAEQALRSVLSRSPLLSGALYNLGVIRARRKHLAEAAALIRQSWFAGMMDPDQILKDPDLAAVVKTPGLLDDLLKTTKPRCGAY
ncbi:MAG: hypothetical protein SFW67_36745 [Myxococcaceae bacterium]|nr:hypothetical protein [Myxococcaceae bacterium]